MLQTPFQWCKDQVIMVCYTYHSTRRRHSLFDRGIKFWRSITIRVASKYSTLGVWHQTIWEVCPCYAVQTRKWRLRDEILTFTQNDMILHFSRWTCLSIHSPFTYLDPVYPHINYPDWSQSARPKCHTMQYNMLLFFSFPHQKMVVFRIDPLGMPWLISYCFSSL